MSVFKGLARFARSAMESRSAEKTQQMLDALPDHVQSDIGWRWAPRTRGQHKSGAIGFVGF